MDFLKRYKKMISLRGLTDHTVKSYCTYISAYLDYISDTLHKYPSQVTYNDQRRFLDHLKEEGVYDNTRIITAASTDKEVFAPIRFITILLKIEISCELKLVKRMKIAIAINAFTFLLFNTGPVNNCVNFGDMKPTRVMNNVTPINNTRSETAMFSQIYCKRPPTPMLLKGKGL